MTWRKVEAKIVRGDLGPAEAPPIEVKGPQRQPKRSITIKVRVTPGEFALVDEITNSLKFGERALALRWLITHYHDLERAARVVETFRKRRALDQELDGLLGSGLVRERS